MATERKRVAGELVAWLIAGVRQAVWGEDLPRLDALNPYHIASPKSEAMQRLEQWQARRRWRIMHSTEKPEAASDPIVVPRG